MNLIRSFTTVGAFTMLSRVLGYIRDLLIAVVLGAGPIADVFFVAFRIPNLFRRLFAEGAFNSAFVPLFAKQLEADGKSSARQFAEESLSFLLFILLVITLIAELAMPVLIYLIAPGFVGEGSKFELAVLFTRIAFPYLLFVSLVALYSGAMNALGRFTAAAAAPVLLNIVLISVLLVLAFVIDLPDASNGLVLTWGVFFAGVAQLLMLIIAARKAGLILSPKRPRLTPQVKRLIQLGIPGVISGGITQINLFVGTIIASLQASAVSYLYYADRIYQLPLGVIGIAIGVVLLPEVSRRLRAGDRAKADYSQNRALEISMLLTLPAAVALIVIPAPIVAVLFEHGKFDSIATIASSNALMAFAFGLPAFVLVKIFSPGFFAREDTKTPMYFAAISVGVNIFSSIVLFFPFGYIGIAIGTTIAGWVNAILLGYTLYKNGYWIFDDQTKKRLPRIILSSVLMGLLLLFLISIFSTDMFIQGGLFIRVNLLAFAILAGLIAYGTIVHISGGADLREIYAVIRRKKTV